MAITDIPLYLNPRWIALAFGLVVAALCMYNFVRRTIDAALVCITAGILLLAVAMDRIQLRREMDVSTVKASVEISLIAILILFVQATLVYRSGRLVQAGLLLASSQVALAHFTHLLWASTAVATWSTVMVVLEAGAVGLVLASLFAKWHKYRHVPLHQTAH